MATKAEVVQRVGEDLGIVPIAQPLEAQDEARIGTAFDECFAFLKEKGLASWASTGDAPTKIVPFLSLFIAEKLLNSFSVPESRALRVTNSAGPSGVFAVQAIAMMTIQENNSTDDVEDF